MLDIVQGTPAKNAQESLEDITKFVESLYLQESCKLFLCCDSAGVYYKVRSLLKSSSTSPFTLVGGCMAHQSNLFLKDLIKSSGEVGSSIHNAIAIAKTVCKSTALNHSILQIMKAELKVNIESFALWVPTLT